MNHNEESAIKPNKKAYKPKHPAGSFELYCELPDSHTMRAQAEEEAMDRLFYPQDYNEDGTLKEPCIKH